MLGKHIGQLIEAIDEKLIKTNEELEKLGEESKASIQGLGDELAGLVNRVQEVTMDNQQLVDGVTKLEASVRSFLLQYISQLDRDNHHLENRMERLTAALHYTEAVNEPPPSADNPPDQND